MRIIVALSLTVNSILAPDTNGRIDPVAAKTEISRVVDVYRQEMGGDTARGYAIIYIICGVAAVLATSLMILKITRRKKRLPR